MPFDVRHWDDCDGHNCFLCRLKIDPDEMSGCIGCRQLCPDHGYLICSDCGAHGSGAGFLLTHDGHEVFEPDGSG